MTSNIQNRHEKPNQITSILPLPNPNLSQAPYSASLNTPPLYFSKVKRSDRYLSSAIQEGYLDHTGTFVDKTIDRRKPIPTLEELEQKNVKNSLDIEINVTKPTRTLSAHTTGINLSVKAGIKSLLSNIQKTLESQHFCSLNEIQLVGGIVPHCLRGKYLEKWLLGLFGEHIGKIPTLELINHDVFSYMEQRPSDIDSRIIIKNPNLDLKYLREELINEIAKFASSSNSLEEIVNFLHSLHKEYAYVNEKTKGLIVKTIKAAYLLKSYSSPSPNTPDQLAIVSCGDRADMVFEILLQLNLERNCLFRRDSLRINIKRFLETGNPSELTLESDFQQNQVLSDWNGQIIHVPNIHAADEDDWPALMSRMMGKGERCLTPGTEKKLFEIFAAKAKENNKELPTYIINCFSKRLTNHHFEDASANIALAFQVCSSMKHCGASSDEINAVWNGLTPRLTTSDNSLLHQIAQSLINLHVKFEDVLAIIELGSFYFLNATKETEKNPVILTQHEGAAVEIIINSKNRNYHLWHRFDPESALSHIQKLNWLQPELLTIFDTFIVWSKEASPGYASQKDQLPPPFKLETFSNKVNQLLCRADSSLSLLGAYLHLSCQSICPTSPQLLLENVSNILINKSPREYRIRLCQQIGNQYPPLMTAIQEISKTLLDSHLTKSSFIESWILNFSKVAGKESWASCSLRCDELDQKNLLSLLKQLSPSKASFVIYLLCQYKSNKLHVNQKLTIFVEICLKYPLDQPPVQLYEDITSLYNIANKIVRSLKSPEDRRLATIENNLIWLIDQIKESKRKRDEVIFVLNACQKNLLSPEDPDLLNITKKSIIDALNQDNAQRLFQVINEAQKTHIKWKTLVSLTDDDWIKCIDNLLNLNTDEANEIAESLLNIVKDQNSKKIKNTIQKFLEKQTLVGKVSLNKIKSYNFHPYIEFKLILNLINYDIKKRITKTASTNLCDLMSSYNPEYLTSLQGPIKDLLNLILGKNEYSNENKIEELRSVFFHSKFSVVFQDNLKDQTDCYNRLFELAIKSTFSSHYDLIIICLTNILSPIKTSSILTKETTHTACTAIVQYLNMKYFADKAHSAEIFQLIESSLSILLTNCHNYKLLSESSILIASYLSIQSKIPTDLIPILFSDIRLNLSSYKSTSQELLPPPLNFEVLFKKLDKSHEWDLELFETAKAFQSIHLYPYSILITKFLLKNPVFNPEGFSKFVQVIIHQSLNLKQYFPCATLLLDSNHLFPSPNVNLEDLIPHLLDLKHDVFFTALNLMLVYKCKDKNLWTQIIQRACLINEKDTLEIIWNWLQNEASDRSIYLEDDVTRCKFYVSVLEKLDKYNSNAALQLHSLEYIIDSQETTDADKLILLLIKAVIRELRSTNDEDKKKELLSILLRLIPYPKHDTNITINTQYYETALDLANIYIQQDTAFILNAGLDQLCAILKHAEEIITKKGTNPLIFHSTQLAEVYLNTVRACTFNSIQDSIDINATQIVENLRYINITLLSWETIQVNITEVIRVFSLYYKDIGDQEAYMWMLRGMKDPNLKNAKLTSPARKAFSQRCVLLMTKFLMKLEKPDEIRLTNESCDVHSEQPDEDTIHRHKVHTEAMNIFYTNAILNFFTDVNFSIFIPVNKHIDLWEKAFILKSNYIRREPNVDIQLQAFHDSSLSLISISLSGDVNCLVKCSTEMIKLIPEILEKIYIETDDIIKIAKATSSVSKLTENLLKCGICATHPSSNIQHRGNVSKTSNELIVILYKTLLNKYKELSSGQTARLFMALVIGGILDSLISKNPTLSPESIVDLLDESMQSICQKEDLKNFEYFYISFNQARKIGIYKDHPILEGELLILKSPKSIWDLKIDKHTQHNVFLSTVNKMLSIPSFFSHSLALLIIESYLNKTPMVEGFFTSESPVVIPLINKFLSNLDEFTFDIDRKEELLNKLWDILIRENKEEFKTYVYSFDQTPLSRNTAQNCILKLSNHYYNLYIAPVTDIYPLNSQKRLIKLHNALGCLGSGIRAGIFEKDDPVLFSFVQRMIQITPEMFEIDKTIATTIASTLLKILLTFSSSNPLEVFRSKLHKIPFDLANEKKSEKIQIANLINSVYFNLGIPLVTEDNYPKDLPRHDTFLQFGKQSLQDYLNLGIYNDSFQEYLKGCQCLFLAYVMYIKKGFFSETLKNTIIDVLTITPPFELTLDHKKSRAKALITLFSFIIKKDLKAHAGILYKSNVKLISSILVDLPKIEEELKELLKSADTSFKD